MRNTHPMSIASRTIATCLAAAVSLAVGVAIAAQQPRITNGQVAPRQAASPFAQSVRALAAGQTDAAWIGYAVRSSTANGSCAASAATTFVNRTVSRASGSEPRVPARAVGRQDVDGPPLASVPEHRRRHARRSLRPDDCLDSRGQSRNRSRARVLRGRELDAGGRRVIWLNDVRPADSVALLESVACRRKAAGIASATRRDHRDRAARRSCG